MGKLCASVMALLFLAWTAGAQDSNRFRLSAGTAMTGTEDFQVSKTPDGFRVAGKVHTERPGGAMDVTHEETLAPDRTLVRYTLQTTGQLIEAWRQGETIQMKVTVRGQSQSKSVPFTPETVVLDNLVTAHFQVLLDRLAGSGEGPWTMTALVPQAMAALPLKVSRGGEEAGTLNGAAVRVRQYTVQLANVLEEVWSDTATNRLMRVAVPMQKVEIARDGFALAPSAEAAPAGPSACAERPVQVVNGAVTLPGTLCLPARATAKVPLVVMVHGSGPQDRDETIGPNKPFRDLAEGLAAASIGSLRYDKRTFALRGTGRLDVKTLTVEEETIADAVAAVQLARTVPEVDASRVFVLGHSQGATFAPAIADRAHARGAILMAAAERPLDQVVAGQVAFQMKVAKQPQADIDARVAELTRAFARVRSGEAPDDETVFGATARYWRDFLSRDPLDALRKTTVPVLLLQGGKDVQVSKADYDLAQQALAPKAPAMRDAHFFPSLNHLFMAVEGEPTGAEYGKPGHVAPEVIQIITAWIAAQE